MSKIFYVLGLWLFVFYASSSLWAEPADNDPQALLAKIERAEHNQREIFKQLAEVKQELYVIKIRATRKIVAKKKA